MKSNRTKILSIIALIMTLCFQFFWMWNTYNINARQLSDKCDDLLSQVLQVELNRRLNTELAHDTILCDDNLHPVLSIYYNVYEKCHKDANLDSLNVIADSIFRAERIPFHCRIVKIMRPTLKLAENKGDVHHSFPYLYQVKSKAVPVRRDQSVAFQMVSKDAFVHIVHQNWILLFSSLLTSLVFILSIIDQINYINEQERVKLLREDFSYAMVHDMKSPLTSIIMGTRYLHGGMLDKKPDVKEKYFTIVEDEAQHLLSLINRLLTISKLEHGKLNICKSEVELQPMIDDVTVKYKAKASKPFEVTTDIACPTVFADEEYLKEVISNLVDNAAKYSKEEIHIKISAEEDSRYTYIKVYDEGIGIAKSELRHIFNRYERAAEHERNPKKTRGGFGIGLNYVLQVVKAHGGKIAVRSEKDKYSEFTIALPKK